MDVIRRLNMDNSWELTWGGTTLLLDPWLLGSEVDGFSWFNEQWHATKPVPPEDLQSYDGVVVSQSYSDHLHDKTLEVLNDVPVISPPSALKRLRRSVPAKRIVRLNEIQTNNWHNIGTLSLCYLDPNRKIDPIYNGIVIRKGTEAIIYFPHGFHLSPAQQKSLADIHVKLLITSFSLFRLPSFMGGDVNPGKKNAMALIAALDPELVVHTHDENKHARGLVKKIAKTEFPDPMALEKELAGKFKYLQYESLPL